MTGHRRPQVVAVVGPTAAGKSGLAVALARRLGGEVVNADSMQLYRGMDIGTAKPSDAERGGVAHHLLDVWDVTETASAARYRQLARDVIDGLLARGVTPIVVGGSGLYLRAALDEFEFPGTDAALRTVLEAELERRGPAALHARLARTDPPAAAAILPGNGRRIVRALEVIELTGRPFSARLPAYRYAYDARQLGVDRLDLGTRIATRVEVMWARGLIDEVRRLDGIGLRRGRTASRALGYTQVLGLFDGVYGPYPADEADPTGAAAGSSGPPGARTPVGPTAEESARDDIVRSTRRFARRQRSWFRRDPRVRWVSSADPDAAMVALGSSAR